MADDIAIYQCVTELIELLGVSNVGAQKYMETLAKSVTPHVTTQVSAHAAVKKITETSTKSEAFLKKYNDLKGKNVRNLDALVLFLSKVSDDKKVRHMLDRNASATAKTLKPTSSSQSEVCGKQTNSSEVNIEELRHLIQKQNRSRLDSQPRVDLGLENESRLQKFVPVPEFITARPYQSWDFVRELDDDVEKQPLGAVPVSAQENKLIEDLLYCMSGVPGNYIKPGVFNEETGSRNFELDESVDPSYKELVRQILPLCSSYSTVTKFIEEKSMFDAGQVNQALAAAIRGLLKDYMLLITQLESLHIQGNLTLHKMWFYVQSSMETMEILAGISQTLTRSSASGGQVLTLLHERTSSLSTSENTHKLCMYLTQAACIPYMEMLEKWVYKGIIADPYGEFLVEDNEVIEKEKLPVDYSDEYWEKRYTIRRERIPQFLETVADMILRTGKYLNVIRQCDETIKCPEATQIVYTNREREYVESLEKAYIFASKTLLQLLMEEKDLMGRLRSVKHYFLLDQGDFIVQFLDLCEEELQKSIGDVVPTRIESLLELALRTSCASSDPYHEDVQVELLPFDLMTQMFKILSINTVSEKDYFALAENLQLSGIESLAFGYSVKWPVSLILNRKALACYQMIFRHLFYSKYVERFLCSVWISNKVAKNFPYTSARTYGSAFALRQRMLNFVLNLEYFMMFEVIEPNWHIFIEKMKKVTNVDEVLQCHTDFIDTCLKDCMLTDQGLLTTLAKLMATCVNFCTFMKSPEPEQSLSESESFEQTITKFDLQFSGILVSLLYRISQMGREDTNEKLLSIHYRLDYNSYYTEQLDKFCAGQPVLNGGTERTRMLSS